MITSQLDGIGESKPQLSEESEEEILQMVEEQLDRPNPPNTKVLYRRAMHFIDRNVRHLSLQQFNAKFPLQVKRRRSEEAVKGSGQSQKTNGGQFLTESASQRSSNGRDTVASSSVEKEEGSSRPRGAVPETNGAGESREGNLDLYERRDREELRQGVRRALLSYAKRIGSAGTRAELVEAVPEVDEYVEQALST